jgi:hypothetical protein
MAIRPPNLQYLVLKRNHQAPEMTSIITVPLVFFHKLAPLLHRRDLVVTVRIVANHDQSRFDSVVLRIRGISSLAIKPQRATYSGAPTLEQQPMDLEIRRERRIMLS